MSSMKRWTRWQDWVAVAAGLYAALASIWTTPRTGATISLLIVLGVLMIAAGVWSLAAPEIGRASCRERVGSPGVGGSWDRRGRGWPRHAATGVWRGRGVGGN